MRLRCLLFSHRYGDEYTDDIVGGTGVFSDCKDCGKRLFLGERSDEPTDVHLSGLENHTIHGAVLNEDLEELVEQWRAFASDLEDPIDDMQAQQHTTLTECADELEELINDA